VCKIWSFVLRDEHASRFTSVLSDLGGLERKAVTEQLIKLHIEGHHALYQGDDASDRHRACVIRNRRKILVGKPHSMKEASWSNKEYAKENNRPNRV